jgi:transcriptional regulator with XRE-family HTH domain
MEIFSDAGTLRQARRAAGLNQGELAAKAGLSRMTVQKIEAGNIDPRISTLRVLLRALGLDVVLVPAELRPAVEDFIHAGGRIVAQPAGVGAPPSIVDTLARAPSAEAPERPGRRRRG